MAIRSTEAVSSAPDQEGCGPGLGPAALCQSGVPGAGSPMRWFFSAIWLVYLIQPVSELFGHHHGVGWIVGGLAITVAFCVIYMLVLMYSDMQPRLARYGLVAIAALAALACAVYGKDWTTLWIYVSAATGLVLAAAPDGRQAATLGVAGVGACYVFFCWVSHSRARHWRIRLSGRMDELSLEVTDDGHGFAGQDPDHPRGSGLRGMSERLSAVGGRLSLGSAEPSPGDRNDRGFRLVATVPAAPAMAAAGHNCPP